MIHADFASASWRKSSHSGGDSGMCVEVAQVAGIVGIRDSKAAAGPVLRFHRREFAALLDAVRTGVHDAAEG